MKRLVKVGDHWNGIVYKGQNLIVQLVKQGTGRGGKTLIIGNGHSVTLDRNNNVVRADPGQHYFVPNIDKDNVSIYCFYFPSFYADLEQAGIDLSRFVNLINKAQDVILVGHSKAGICVEIACRYVKELVDKCIAVSAPHAGTISVNPKLFCKKLNDPLVEYVCLKTFSNHKVDRDVLPDSNVIRENIKEGKGGKWIRHINFVSVLEAKSAWRNIVDFVLWLLDRRVGIHGDGIVPLNSQHVCWTSEEIVLHCSHARSLELAIEYINYYFL